MKTLSQDRFQTIREGAKVLTADKHGDKVLKLKNGHIMELFRRKRLFSSALIYPYGKRFVDNVKQLIKRDIPTVGELSLFRVPSISRIAVVYRPLPGESLEEEIKDKRFGEERIRQFGEFLARLHVLGIYFRSIHLRNVIVTLNGQLGLIDVSDMKIYRRSLPASLRARNIRHFCRYPGHAKALFPQGKTKLFIDAYLNATELNDEKKAQLASDINSLLEKQ